MSVGVDLCGQLYIGVVYVCLGMCLLGIRSQPC